MKERSTRQFLEDILESIVAIFEYTKSMDSDQFIDDLKTKDAVTRRFEIIGEAAKHIPNSLKKEYQETPWKHITGTRDILIHDYYDINIERIWRTIKTDLPIFEGVIKKMLQDFK